jgi:Uma2 family endonuclease
MAAQPKIDYITAAEYLAMERKADYKSECFKGEVFAMAGASNNHNIVVSELIFLLRNFLKGKSCTVYPSDMRVHIPENSLFTYPDVMVVCGKKKFLEDTDLDTILNPVLIVEVLSDSTESYDRGKKFELYRGLPSLKEYVLVSSSKRYSIERFFLNSQGVWEFADSQDLKDGFVSLQSIGLDLYLKDVYADIEQI